MFIDTFQYVALEEYERASTNAAELAERIRHSGRAGTSNAEMVELLKAWQMARDAARASHDRLLAKRAPPFRPEAVRLARTYWTSAA